MDKFGNDRRVIDAFRFVATFGEQVTSFLRRLDNEVTSEIRDRTRALQLAIRPRPDESIGKDSPSGWASIAEARSIPLWKPDGRARQPFAYLNFEVVLDGDGLVPGVQLPVLHVSVWNEPVAYAHNDDQCYVGFPCDPRPEVVAERLLVWSPSEWNAGALGLQWTFSIRLLALDGSEQINKLVIGPALTFLAKRQQLHRDGKVDKSLVREILPDALLSRDLIRYHPRHLDGQPAPIS
jgi:hypothetical protein